MTETIEQFYQAFKALDSEKMVSCYADNIHFEDPAFGTLHGERAKNMWRMLCESQKGKDFKIEFSNITSNSDTGSAHWEAFYTFSKTGRKVHNKIEAEFEFKDGKIVKHIDSFNLHRWAKQAMGLKGFILGGTSFFRKKLQVQTNNMLDRYMTSKK
ncbi:MAG: nuclear transport factor 2 family protein [Psychroserpens sp.]|nr:nuclear transport factor 2 family protein [Psychroserpens sp.]